MRLKKYDNVIGIDPDVKKSGVSYLQVRSRKLEASSLTFPDLLDYLQHVKKTSDEQNETVVVVVEAGWLISHHWHTKRGDNRKVAAAKGNSAGRNHEVGRKIVEMCKHFELEVIEQRPLRKTWKGRDGKITHDELAYFTGIMGRTNQEMRDAALIAWNFAGLPIRVKVGLNKK